MIRIAVCDDDAVMCGLLEEKISVRLKEMGERFHITCCTSAIQLLSSAMNYDLIFLDIQMPGLDGVALAKALREKACPCALIFATVLQDRMLDAFEVEASGYLCKPVDDTRLESALKRALRQLDRERADCILVHAMNWCRAVKIRDIRYCEVIDRKIYLHTENEVIIYYGKIKELEKQLNGRLIRCHRSYLVNPDFLREFTDGQIYLEGGGCIPVSRSRRQAFMEAMLQYLKRGE